MLDLIDTAIFHPISKAAYFFRGSHYVKFVPGEGVQLIGETRIRRIGIDGWKSFPDNFHSDLDAAFVHPNGHLYFFKGGEYVKYKPGKGVVSTDSGLAIRTIGVTGWKSFPLSFRSDIDAAVFVPELGHAYFFKSDEYIKVKFDETGKDSIVESNGSSIRKLGVQGWRELPNPFAKCLDAALYCPNDDFLYFFRDREYVRWNPDHGISARYPRRLGQLHREHEGWPGLSSLLGGPFLGSVTASTASIWIWVLGGRSTSDLVVRLNGSQEVNPEFIAPPVGTSASDVFEGVEEVDPGGMVRLLQLTRLAENTSYSVEFRRADDNSLIETICFKTPPAAISPGLIRIGMGTCSNSTTEVAVDTFEAMANSSLDILLLGGDNCYYYNGKKTSTSPASNPPHDWASVGRMIRRQLECRNHPQFVPIARSVPTFSTWDDHDFSFNNCDGLRDRDDSRWVGRDRAAGVYRLMWNHPFRSDGNHIFYDFRWGPIHFFITDGRFHSNRPDGILGPEQTNWLLNGIRTSDAPIRMVLFSSQFVAETGGECFFASATQERMHILDTIINDVTSPVLFLSGDIHRSELQRYPINSNTPRILEITSSPLKVDELDTPLRANSNRLWQTVQNSFALINVDYQGGTSSDITGSITLEAIGANGAVLNNNGTNTPCRTVWNLSTLQLS